MKLIIKTQLTRAAMFLLAVGNALAGPTSLPLRSEGQGVAVPAGVTTQTIEASFGSSLTVLSFSNTSTYDFYSPPLSVAATIGAKDAAGGKVFMRNTSTTPANDFQASGRMQFYDYDPVQGTATLIADTMDSAKKDVHHGETVSWPLTNKKVTGATTIAAGHRLHISATVTLVSGNPGSFGQFLFNGPSGSSSVAQFPQNRVMTWSFASLPPKLWLAAQPGNSVLVTCAGEPNEPYVVQATTNLAAPVWVNVTNRVTDATGICSFRDADAVNYPCRFYRAVSGY